MSKIKPIIMSIPDKEMPRMVAALDKLRGKLGIPTLAADGGGSVSGTKCGATNISGPNGEYDFSCKDDD